jgi:hypothetical protein
MTQQTLDGMSPMIQAKCLEMDLHGKRLYYHYYFVSNEASNLVGNSFLLQGPKFPFVGMDLSCGG